MKDYKRKNFWLILCLVVLAVLIISQVISYKTTGHYMWCGRYLGCQTYYGFNLITDLDLLHKVIEFLGTVLLINAVYLILSDKYYSFLNNTFFIQPLSEKSKLHVREFVQNRQDRERFGVFLICILLGLIALHWSFGGHLSFFY
jgi:hypothetical protein